MIDLLVSQKDISSLFRRLISIRKRLSMNTFGLKERLAMAGLWFDSHLYARVSLALARGLQLEA